MKIPPQGTERDGGLTPLLKRESVSDNVVAFKGIHKVGHKYNETKEQRNHNGHEGEGRHGIQHNHYQEW